MKLYKLLTIFFGGLYFAYSIVNNVGNQRLTLVMGIGLAIWAWIPNEDDFIFDVQSVQENKDG